MSDVVEILLATYNGAAFLEEQLDSILAQTDNGWHLTISDDGSNDSTPEIINRYVLRYPDRIACYRSGRRFGNARDHFFQLLAQCDAEHMLLCDQDDVWYPEKVRRMRKAFLQVEAEAGADTPILVFSDQTPTDAMLRPLATSLMRYQKQHFKHFDYRSILMQNVVTGGAMGINRALVRLAECSKGIPGIYMHDWWLATVAARFGRIVYIDEPLGVYRQHENNVEGAKNVGSLGYFARRTRALGEVRHTILRKKAQAEAFERTFEAKLSSKDIAFLREFTRTRSGIFFWLKYQHLIHGAVRKVGMLLLC